MPVFGMGSLVDIILFHTLHLIVLRKDRPAEGYPAQAACHGLYYTVIFQPAGLWLLNRDTTGPVREG